MAAEVPFDELRAARKDLREAVTSHRHSLWWFKHPTRPWFVLEADRREAELADENPDHVRHLSSTATCLESLHDPLAEPDDTYSSTISNFATRALSHPDNTTWSSEEAAQIYCRVRTLTPILALAPAKVLASHQKAVEQLIVDVWSRVEPGNPARQGVAEAPKDEAQSRQGYPPNAFHTYWAIRMLEERNRHQVALGSLPPDIGERRSVAELWARQTLATQTALIRFDADRVDAHQLAWALSTEFLGTETIPVTASTPRLELYQAALDAYFQAQLPSGAWPLYQPLFHYPAAGNAYCYTFETLAVLLRPALHRHGGQVLRTLLKPYLPNLLRAWQFAARTRIELEEGVVGWCSGHHPHRTSAEAWATAAVFQYLQALRCLVGYWTVEEAVDRRRGRRPERLGDDAAQFLAQRGNLWATGDGWSAGRHLSAMFLHPIQARINSSDWIDPDKALIKEMDEGQDQARAAILFGPPGTGKTTLVESLAGAIDWRFVEVLASDFLSEGMDQVPAKADEIFDQLMELDHCVILFDEIDELMRKRDNESDPFGRFLTTSMLPKLAKLWDQRRVLFFVATNDVDAADPAIKRSHRFDARLFVTPPAFHVKRKLLTKALRDQGGKKYPAALKESTVTASLQGAFGEADSYGVFALLRYDQMSELARLMIQETGDPEAVPAAAAKAALARLGRQLRAVEWEHAELDPYALYRHHRQNESYDNRMLRLARLPPGVPLPSGLEVFEGTDETRLYARLAHSVAMWPDPLGSVRCL